MRLFLLLAILLAAATARAASAGAWASQAQTATVNDTNFVMALTGNAGVTNDNQLISVANFRTAMRGTPALPVFTGGSLIDDAGTQAWFTPRNYMLFYEDFTGSTSPFANASTGTSATFAVFTPVDAGHLGIFRADTGSTTTGKGVGHLGNNGLNMCFGNGRWLMEWLANLENLSDGTDSYIARIGYGDQFAGGPPVDGAFFRYSDSVNSGNWQCITANNSTYTTNNTSVAATASTTGGAWTRFNIDVDAAGANAVFYINGASVATNSANIPITIARGTAPFMEMEKTAGTTNRRWDVDYVFIYWKPTTPR